MSCQLTLLVPGLLQPPQPLQALPPQEQPGFISLNRFFGRARKSESYTNGFYPSLFSLFGSVTAEKTDYPVAALTHLIDSGDRTNAWTLRCDPVCFQADMDRVVLQGHGALGLSVDEVDQLITILNAHIEQDGWQIEALTKERWYVQGAKQVDVSTTPPALLLGKDIKHDLPRGKDGAYWRSLMNECQMLLHELPMNVQRQEKGLLPVTGLWFWGCGALPASTSCQYDRIYGSSALVAGLAQNAACAYESIGALWQFVEQGQDTKILAVSETLQSPLVSQDLYSWLDAVAQFEEEFIQPLLERLNKKMFSQVNLLSADGRAFQLTPGLLRHWWKRQTKFNSLLAEATHA